MVLVGKSDLPRPSRTTKTHPSQGQLSSHQPSTEPGPSTLTMTSVVVNNQVLVREKSARYSTPQWRICMRYWTIGGANGRCFGRTGRYDEVMGGFHTSAIQWRINGQEEPRLESPPFLPFFSMLSFLAFKLVSHFIRQRPNPCTHITQAFRQLISSYHFPFQAFPGRTSPPFFEEYCWERVEAMFWPDSFKY